MSALARLQRAQKKSRRTGAAGALRASAAISVANPNRLVWPEPWQPWQAAATTRREESRGDSQRRCVRFSACLRSTARRALMNTPPATATRESNESSPGTHLNAPPIEGSAPLWFSVKVISFFGDICTSRRMTSLSAYGYLICKYFIKTSSQQFSQLTEN